MKQIVLPFVLLLTFCLSSRNLSAQVSIQDSMVLVDLYNSTNGPGWINHTNWLTTKPVTTWFGVGTSSNRVRFIALPENNLVGTIPSSLGNLYGVQLSILFDNNRLSGSLPASLANLVINGSPILQLDHNLLSGSIPKLSGSIPTMGTPVPGSAFLDISYNNFTFSAIEPTLTSNGAGGKFVFFTDSIEADLPLIQNGNILSIAAGGTVANNTYTWYKDGTIVATITGDSTFAMTGSGTYSVSVTNKLIPTLSLYSIQNINTQDSIALVDFYNSTGGSNWVKSSNWATSAPAASWFGVTARLGKVQKLYLPYNNLTGSIPSSFGNLTGITTINFNSNQLTGTLPSSLSSLTALNALYLSGNQFTGAIPSVLSTLSALQILALNYNPFSGSIPASLSSLSQLRTLSLSRDHLSGNIPPELGNMTNLSVLELDYNHLTDTIPASLGNMTNITQMFLDSNQLTGHIPASLGRLTHLAGLYLYDNQLTGIIPDSLFNMPALNALYLNDNQLTGNLPDSFGKQNVLEELNVTNNNLSGTIPAASLSSYISAGSKISGNKYTFSISTVPIPSALYFVYAPQQNIRLTRTEDKLSVAAGGNSAHSTYTLYKDGSTVVTQTADSLFTIGGLGNYNIVTTNTDAPLLTLYSDTLKLGLVLPDSTITMTQTISGSTPVDINTNIFRIATLTPGAAGNALTGNVTALETVDATIQTFNGVPYVQRHYDITPVLNPASSTATITLYFTQSDFDTYNTYITSHSIGAPLLPTGGIDNGNVIITQYHGSFTGTSDPANYSQGSQVIQPTVTWNASDEWWAVTFPVSGFSGFFLGTTGGTPLPLTLLKFTGTPQDYSVNLQWQTTDEQNTKQFIVQHSRDGSVFDPIGTVAANNTTGKHQYEFVDSHPFTGDNFYRLKMQDFDGQFTYSPIVEVAVAGLPTAVMAYPNPAANSTALFFNSTGSSNFSIRISDLNGKILALIPGISTAGINKIDIDVHSYAPGIYTITLTDTKQGRSSIRLLKK